MSKISAITHPVNLPKTYAALVALHVPRLIRDKVDYDNTVALIDLMAGHKLNHDQEEYLELLATLVETYEREHLAPLPRVCGIELLNHLLEANDLGGDDLAAILGVDRSVAFKILKGTRNLTTDHLRKLAGRFAVSGDLFL